MTAPAVTAIVVTYHTGPRLKECLYALCADPEVAATIIVNNGNPEVMTAWLTAFASSQDQVSLLHTPENLGFGRAVNFGAASASTSNLLIINPDAVLRRGSIGSLQDAASELNVPWIVGGRIFNLKGREDRGARRRELTLFRAMTRVIGWNTWTMEHDAAPAGPVDMPVVSGAFFLTSAESFKVLGGFDEGYFLHVEDIDLCRRCREMGGRVIYDPGAGALHYGSTAAVDSKTVARHKADGLSRYFKTYARGPLERVLVMLAMPFIRAAVLFRAH